jgi:hypothetical protein
VIGSNWGVDADHVVHAENLISPILTEHPMWLALLGEVILRRSEGGLKTHVVDYSHAGLYDSERHTYRSNVNKAAKSLKEDSLSRFKEVLNSRGIGEDAIWLDPELSLLDAERIRTDAQCRRIMRLNVVSESMSLVGAENPSSALDSSTIQEMVETWELTFSSFFRSLHSAPFDAALVFNGRFVKEGAARAACISADIPVYAFDQGARPGTLAIMRNHVHDHQSYVYAIKDLWENQDQFIAENLAQTWFRERTSTKGGGGNPFSTSFEPFDKEFEPETTVMVVFTTSSHELFSIDIDSGATPNDQDRWIEDLIRLTVSTGDVTLVIREHPSSDLFESRVISGWRSDALQAPGKIRVFDSRSNVNSYDLIKKADVVVTFGSTIGIEAAYLGKPVIELCNTHMSRLGACHYAASLQQFKEMMRGREWFDEVKARNQAMKIAFWLNWSGEDLSYASFQPPFASLCGFPLEPFGSSFKRFHYLYFKFKVLRAMNRNQRKNKLRHNDHRGRYSLAPSQIIDTYLNQTLEK